MRLTPPDPNAAPIFPGRPPFQGEVIQGRQLFQGEPVDTTPPAIEYRPPTGLGSQEPIPMATPTDIPARISRNAMSDQDLVRAQQLLVKAGDPRADIVGRELMLRNQEDANAATPDEMPSGPAPETTPQSSNNIADDAAAPAPEFKAPWELPKESEKVQAQSLRQWVRANGGLQDEGGDVKSLLDKPQIGILNKNGMTLDQAREGAAEAGYLGADRNAATQVDRQPLDQGASASTAPTENSGDDFFPNRAASAAATPRDVGLVQSVAGGASGRDLLADIRDNSPSPELRDMAAALHRSGADAKVQFSDPDGLRFNNDVANVDNARRL